MSKMTHQTILQEWLKQRISTGNKIVASHEIQMDFPRYAKMYWGAMMLPDTASRLWRKFRETRQYKNIGIEEVTEHKTESKEMSWALRKTA